MPIIFLEVAQLSTYSYYCETRETPLPQHIWVVSPSRCCQEQDLARPRCGAMIALGKAEFSRPCWIGFLHMAIFCHRSFYPEGTNDQERLAMIRLKVTEPPSPCVLCLETRRRLPLTLQIVAGWKKGDPTNDMRSLWGGGEWQIWLPQVYTILHFHFTKWAGPRKR